MIDLSQIKTLVIRPALEAIDLWSEEAEELVFHTGYVESLYKYIAQVGGPARSFWQVEPVTMYDHYESYLHYRIDLLEKVNSLFGGGAIGKVLINHDDCQVLNLQLIMNMAFAVAMCRIKYRRSSLPLPACGDIPGQAYIWKKCYNTEHGAGTEEKFITLIEGLK